jgi:hypothetical protein
MLIGHGRTLPHLRHPRCRKPERKVEVIAGVIHNSTEVERAFADFAANGSGGGIIALLHPFTEINRDLIIRQTTTHLMPSIFAFEAQAYAGALATYGIDRSDAV